MCMKLMNAIVTHAQDILAPSGGLVEAYTLPSSCDGLHVELVELLVIACELVANAESGTPAPMPAKAPRDGSTKEELQCIKIAYLLYRIQLLDGVPQATAWANYCANFDACYPE